MPVTMTDKEEHSNMTLLEVNLKFTFKRDNALSVPVATHWYVG